MSDYLKEIAGDPYAHLREMDSHAAILKIVNEGLDLLAAGKTDGLPPWGFNPDGTPNQDFLKGERVSLEAQKAYLEAEIAAGRTTPLASHLAKLETY